MTPTDFPSNSGNGRLGSKMPTHLTDANDEDHTFPMFSVWPVECESDLFSISQGGGRQIHDLETESGVTGRTVMGSMPIVSTPVTDRGRHRHDTQHLADRQGADLMVEAPDQTPWFGFVFQVAFHGLRRHVEYPAVA